MKWTLLFCVFFCLASGLPSFQRALDESLGDLQDGPPEQWFTQRLSHFNKQEQRTWQQRYFVNDSFFNPGLGGPIFVQIGGEGAISPAYVTRLEMVQYAQKFGALCVAVEHRFYGKSKPLPDLSTPNLQYLSSQEALADLANFIVTMKARWGFPNAPVVTFGGSYPGSLSAWFRLKFPHVTIASVASSAPVRAELDFYQYLDVVDESLSSVTGINCDARLNQASASLANLLSTPEGQRSVERLFNICKPLQGEKDIANFVSTIMGNFMGVVQYDNEQGPITIETLCNIMNNNSMDPLTAYAATSALYTNGECLDASYEDMMAGLQNLTQPPTGVADRSWTYQTCAEFGFFQTTDSRAQPFGSLVPLSFYTEQCQTLFGMPGPYINETNAYYGSNHPVSATEILFVNGSIDPWHALSVTHDLSPTLKAIFIIGTAHCANMLPARPTDPPGLAKAQQQIAAQINTWLANV